MQIKTSIVSLLILEYKLYAVRFPVWNMSFIKIKFNFQVK